MFANSRLLNLAILFLYGAAALYILAPLVDGFTSDAFTLVPIGGVYLVVAIGLARGRRWLAWLGFFGTLIGGIVALGSALGVTSFPSWWHLLTVGFVWLCALMLFLYLWKPKPTTAST